MNELDKEKFFLIQVKNPTWSSHTCFLNLIRGKKYKDDYVEEMFNKFVEKDDYLTKKTKLGLLEYAKSITWYGEQHVL